MGPVRHRHLIRWLSLVVALNILVGLVAIYARDSNATGREARARVAAGAPSPTTGGVLAGGHFSKRRGSAGRSTGAAPAPGSPATTGTAQPVGRPGPTTGSGPTGSTATTGPRPTTGSVPTTGVPASGGRSTTSSSSPAATTSTGATTSTSGPVPRGGGATTGTAPAGGANRSGNTLTDPVGDTFVDGTQKPITESRADIVRTGAAYGPGGVTFTMQVQQPTDPWQDKRWASETTFAMWAVDTNGDSVPDFEIQYSFDGTVLAGSVSRPGDAGPAVCNASAASYGPDGYSVTVDPACLGNPASFAYRAKIYYDTNPKDDNADVASDEAPNGGWSFPVSRPAR